MKHFRLIIAGISFLLLSCQVAKVTAPPQAGSCPQTVQCTLEFASVQVKITDGAGQPVAPDSAVVYQIFPSNQGYLRISAVTGPQAAYTVLDDSYLRVIKNKKAAFSFEGFKGGKKIFEEVYAISADCCHVRKDSGKDVIVIDLAK